MKLIKILLAVILITIVFHNFCQANIDKDTINEAFTKAGFKIDDFFTCEAMLKSKIGVGPWSSPEAGCQYPNEEKKHQIKNTKSVQGELILKNNIILWINLANFKNKEDAHYGYAETCGELVNYKETLFSGKKIENADLITQVRPNKFAAYSYLSYKNCVCKFYFRTSQNELQKEDFQIMDDIIKLVIKIIEKSIKE